MKKTTSILILAAAIYTTPLISLAQECGGWLGARCATGEACMTIDATTGQERPANVAIDEGGICKPSTTSKPTGGNNQAPTTPPTWYGTEDGIGTITMLQPPSQKKSIFSWLTDTLLKPAINSADTQQSTTLRAGDCWGKAMGDNCKQQITGITGRCGAILTTPPTLTCIPRPYARAPKKAAATAYAPTIPPTFATPCVTEAMPGKSDPKPPSGKICTLPDSCNKGGYGQSTSDTQCKTDLKKIDLTNC